MKEKIVVERKRRFYEARYSVGIYIDNEFVVNTIKNNRQEIELSPGKHLLKVEQGNRSGEIEIDVKKGKVLTCTFSCTLLRFFIFITLIGAYILSNGIELQGGGILLIYLPTILITIYTFTKGKSTYFVFEKPTEDDTWMTQ